jgi:hypothetical protein
VGPVAARIGNRSGSISSLDLSGTAVRLATLRATSGSTLTLERTGNEFLLQVSGGGASLGFEARGVLNLKLGDQAMATKDLAGDSISFSAGTSAKSAAGLVLRAAAEKGVRAEDISVSLLRFGRRQQASGGGASFGSSILSGSVSLVDVGRTIDLNSGASIQLESFRGRVLQIETIPSGYALTFAGSADKVFSGPPGFADDLTPTTLEFLYHQSWITMMWASALAGLAALAKIRSWMRGKLG